MITNINDIGPIPCSKPSITAKEREYVLDAMKKCDIGIGEYVGKFESAWAERNNYVYGVACNSGTNAIYLALKALGIGPGDKVVVPEYTMIATAWAVSYTGATPVFVDCDDTLTIDTVELDKILKRNSDVKAIIVVPIYGRPVAKSIYSLPYPIVEDMAEAHGIQPRGYAACYSFYGNKIITTGEGGMVLTNDEEYAEEMRKLANMYFDKGRTMIHPKIGHNFRMTNLQAAVGLAQVERIDEILARRKEIEFEYDAYLNPKFLMPKREVVWMYDIYLRDEEERDEARRRLSEMGIETRLGFKPMSMQPMYFNEKHPTRHTFLNAYRWSQRILYLPTYPDMQQREIVKIARALDFVYERERHHYRTDDFPPDDPAVDYGETA